MIPLHERILENADGLFNAWRKGEINMPELCEKIVRLSPLWKSTTIAYLSPRISEATQPYFHRELFNMEKKQ